MASVSVPPSPRTSLAMSTRRPLATVPNGTNSPHRVSSSTAIKRPRAGPQYDPVCEPPPSKKQLLEQERSSVELQYDPACGPPPSRKQFVDKRISEVQYDSAHGQSSLRKQFVEPERPESRSPSKIRYTYANEGKTVDRSGGSPQKVLVDRRSHVARVKEQQQSSREKEKQVFLTKRALTYCLLTNKITDFNNGADIIERHFPTSLFILIVSLQTFAASVFETFWHWVR